jgi:hypothetical protein
MVIGGETKANGAIRLLNDVWRSNDTSGVGWTKIAIAGFTPRKLFTIVDFNQKLWVIGGTDGVTSYSDVWNSDDGIAWTRVTSNAGFGKRYNHICLVYSGKLWVIGGIVDPETPVNDVWCSSDGLNWQKVASTTNLSTGGFLPNGRYAGVVYRNRMWVIGNPIYENRKVWQSVDGAIWYEAPRDNFTNTTAFNTVVYNDSIWILSMQDEMDNWKSVNIIPTVTP